MVTDSEDKHRLQTTKVDKFRLNFEHARGVMKASLKISLPIVVISSVRSAAL